MKMVEQLKIELQLKQLVIQFLIEKIQLIVIEKLRMRGSWKGKLEHCLIEKLQLRKS